MKKFLIFLSAVVVFLSAAYFYLVIYCPPAEVDGPSGVSYQGRISQHSYVRQPPVLRRALRDQLYIFEVPRENIDEILKLQNGEKEISSLTFKEIQPGLMRDVNRKLTYIKKSLNKKGKKYESHVFSPNTKLYVKHVGGGDPFDYYILVDVLDSNKNNYIVAVDIIWDLNQSNDIGNSLR